MAFVRFMTKLQSQALEYFSCASENTMLGQYMIDTFHPTVNSLVDTFCIRFLKHDSLKVLCYGQIKYKH